MQKLSISFTLGKASKPKQANVDHANRMFIAKNVDQTQTHQNITYVRQDVEDAYEQLFGQAVAEYNRNQKQKCRRIDDYYSHIGNGKREEAFYEIIVQFGDSSTAPCGSINGKMAEKMLDEYVKTFRQRNPNLYIFNAVMHLDEASPHLHINFIPFYTKSRKNGLSKGVSMRSALDEMGFTGENFKSNRLVAWEERERYFMEHILNEHGFMRDDKETKHAHMTVEEFKEYKDAQQTLSEIRSMKHDRIFDRKLQTEMLQEKLELLTKEHTALETKMQSPYKNFYYSEPEKLAFVLTQLSSKNIPYHETENGFEAQECYVDEIRRIEKFYRAPKTSLRENLKQDIDLFLMQSNSFEELLKRLQQAGYAIKTGKYIAVKPPDGENYIRLKSLGEHYSEMVLKNRIRAKLRFEKQIEEQIQAAGKKHTPERLIVQTIQFYTVSFRQNALPMRKKFQAKPFSWTNDAELDKLLSLNKKINSGATLDSLRREFAEQEKKAADCDAAVRKSEHDLKAFYDLKEKIEIVYAGKKSSVYNYEQAVATLREYPNITRDNFRNIDKLIASETESLHQAKAALREETEKLKKSSELVTAMERVMTGTYIQNLVAEERQRRESDFLLNGVKQNG